ncbi:hypothetical protein N7453_004027 [Penicillium expansum]|nr:hypothetical protein N7453_004027 [Penicillium expansum]
MQDRCKSKGYPLLISLYIPRAYRHALIAPCFRSVRFSTSHHIEVNFALFLIFVFATYRIGFCTLRPSHSVSEPFAMLLAIPLFPIFRTLLRRFHPINI